MKINNKQMAILLEQNKVKRFQQKITEGDITFDDCGLDRSKNIFSPSEDVLISSRPELEEYCQNLCAMCVYCTCAIFIIGNDHRVSFAAKFDFNDFDWFDLNETWHCWNFISIEEKFDLQAYGILCEIQPGVWKKIID